MDYYPVYDEANLESGPLFGDEIGWSGGINRQISDKCNLARRGIRFRGGTGVYTIYTPAPKLEAALIRYLDSIEVSSKSFFGEGYLGSECYSSKDGTKTNSTIF